MGVRWVKYEVVTRPAAGRVYIRTAVHSGSALEIVLRDAVRASLKHVLVHGAVHATLHQHALSPLLVLLLRSVLFELVLVCV